ncbi:MAG: hypothetical protein VYA17_07390 [Pseudomonadota bacterium]|nr:hypothetical protein [Pseudomonadota bacterium]
MPHVHTLGIARLLARHVDAPTLGVVEPAMIAAANAFRLDPAVLQRRTAVGAVRIETADTAHAVAEQYQVLAQDADLARQVGEFVRQTDWLPVAAHQLAHRRAGLDMGELGILDWDLVAVARLHDRVS